ncbi:MAG TPA: biotin/lipoate A/B protein ligase family protein [Verrucomicrobiae bacterium]|nr:biotin/lipoate A/B protein ligase family protein [Verrucomicrobiae bacterium]
MEHCELTFHNPALDLACDEVLLDVCEAGRAGSLLRLWEPARHFVVVGYGNAVASEVNIEFCRRHSIPILRRCSGGGTVLQGPGCLNYALLLQVEDHPALQGIGGTNEFVLQRHREALAALLKTPVEKKGHTDLAIGGLKFSGNAQRRRKRFLLFHGCFLLNLDIDLLQQVLPLPSRQPDYRSNRSHADFLLNLKVPAQMLKAALLKAWEATEPLARAPVEQITALAREKYARDEWNWKF